MKGLLAGFLVFSAFSALAADLKITSLNRLTRNVQDNVFETCVKYEGSNLQSATFKFIADPGKRQGVSYQTAFAEEDGNFRVCQVMGVYRGVEVVVLDAQGKVVSEEKRTL